MVSKGNTWVFDSSRITQPQSCDISPAAKKVFMTSSVVLDFSGKYKQNETNRRVCGKYCVGSGPG